MNLKLWLKIMAVIVIILVMFKGLIIGFALLSAPSDGLVTLGILLIAGISIIWSFQMIRKAIAILKYINKDVTIDQDKNASPDNSLLNEEK